MSDKFRSRNFALLLYPEDPSHLFAIKTLEEGGYNFAYILHNEDIWSDTDPEFDSDKHVLGEKKKEHYHVVVKFLNPKWDSAFAKELGIKPNYIREVKNLDKALLYLVHYGHPDKYQYDLDDVVGSLKINLQKLLRDDDEGSRVLQIVEMIDNSLSVSYRDILVKCCKAGLYGEFRRLGCGVKYLLDERRQAEFDDCHNEHERDIVLSGFNDRQKI